jgi:hypothetical protein
MAFPSTGLISRLLSKARLLEELDKNRLLWSAWDIDRAVAAGKVLVARSIEARL